MTMYEQDLCQHSFNTQSLYYGKQEPQVLIGSDKMYMYVSL